MNKHEKILLDRYKKYICSREIYFNYILDYEAFSSSILRHCRPILLEFNTTFAFEKKGNKREGALTEKRLNIKINDKELLVKIIKIRRDVDFISQIHVFFHELSHLVNNHNNQEKNLITLSSPQKEYVAEVSAQALLFSFVGGTRVEDLPDNQKWNHSDYIKLWIQNAKLSNLKIEEMWKQINYAYNLISQTILEKIK